MCCLFGLLDYNHYFGRGEKSKVISVLSRGCEVRGTDATGIAYVSRNHLRIYKRPLPARKMHFFIPDESNVVMGHTRMATQGCERYNANNHPFRGRCADTDFALAHNGILHNDRLLREQYHLPSTNIQTDSYVAVQFLEAQKTLSPDSLKKMAEAVEGSFTFTLLDSGNQLYFVKGSSPMCIYHFKRAGFYLYASTEEILRDSVRKLRLNRLPFEHLNLNCGDILRIDSLGNRTVSSFDSSKLDSCWPPFCCDKSSFRYSHGKERGDPYLQELKDIAGYYGYSPEDVDLLRARGYSCGEIEDLLYGEDMLEEF